MGGIVIQIQRNGNEFKRTRQCQRVSIPRSWYKRIFSLSAARVGEVAGRSIKPFFERFEEHCPFLSGVLLTVCKSG